MTPTLTFSRQNDAGSRARTTKYWGNPVVVVVYSSQNLKLSTERNGLDLFSGRPGYVEGTWVVEGSGKGLGMTGHSPTQILCLKISPLFFINKTWETQYSRSDILLDTKDVNGRNIPKEKKNIEEHCTLANFENIFFGKTDRIVRNKYQVYFHSRSVMI